jgi:phosphoglycerate dehydrogenase-like enzyme/CMP-N-acetylneuraminic acid synthetase
MAKPKILYYSMLQYQMDTLALLNEHFEVIELENPSCDSDEVLATVDVALAPLGYYFGKEKIDKCRSLKAIGSNTTGHPHIDVEYARSKGVSVVTLKYEREFLDTITPTAELTWGLLIALTRNMFPAVASTRQGQWNRRPFPGKKMLSRMSIGIVGLGRLGYKVAQYALKSEMDVSYYDPNVSSAYPGLKQKTSLKELISESDVVTVHVPHEKQNEGMFDDEIFASFKEGAYFVNTSRGELVDHQAFLRALISGRLAGAAIDVFEDEFAPDFGVHFKQHPLWGYAQEHDNLIITPHIGGSTLDAWGDTERHTIQRILEILNDAGGQEAAIKIAAGESWALIPARGGSKSIPLKNLAKLNGVPLIDYAIGAARRTDKIVCIICSTDSGEIGDHCRGLGVEVDERPAELAGDHVATVDVLLEFVRRKAREGIALPEYLVLLEPTSPFVSPTDIEECIDRLGADTAADSAQTVTQVSSNSHAYNQRYHDAKGSNFLYPQERKVCINKQSKPRFYIHGNVRVMRIQSLLRNRSIFGTRSLPIEIPKIRAMDVDSQEDLLLAEAIIASGLVREMELGK